MLKKSIGLLIVIGILPFSVAFAKDLVSPVNVDLPQEEGTYSVPGHANLKLKVIVHRVKPIKTGNLVCNLPDPESASVVASGNWHLSTGNWTYTLNSSSVPASVGKASLAPIVVDAFGKLSSGTNSKITFSQAGDTSETKAILDGQNIITWGKVQGARSIAITYIWIDNAGLVDEVDTIMNNRLPWSWSDPTNWLSPATTCANSNSYDVQNIMTHELGHWIGLDDMYSADYQNATMYGYGSMGEIKKDTLSAGDVSGILAIYP